MPNPFIASTESDLETHTPLTDTVIWSDPKRGGTFLFVAASSPYTNDYGVKFPGGSPSQTGYWVRQFDGDILPRWFGINNDGTLNSQSILDYWMESCKEFQKPVFFPEGKYCLPTNFQKAFGDFDLVIKGIKGKTIITTLDPSNSAATNFAIPAKIDLTRPKPTDGVYQVDIIGPTLYPDFSGLGAVQLDQYVQITGGTPAIVTTSTVKALGYITEFNVLAGAGTDTMDDGLYVVAKHPFLDTAYGGGFTHLNLNGDAGVVRYNTGGLSVLYLQGTILKRTTVSGTGIWARYFSGGAGFSAYGNVQVQDIIFDNVQFYLFSPFDIASSPNLNLGTKDLFCISGCVFKNCARVIASINYGTTPPSPSWFAHVYNENGGLRFRNFIAQNNDFSYVHEAICWGPPPSLTATFTQNSVHDCYTILATFYLYMVKPTNLDYYWQGKITQEVSNNSFINIRPLNPGANSTTTIIRTAGNAVVNSNVYINITQQAVYISSADSTFNDNSISKYIEDASSCPVILIKSAAIGLVEIAGNSIIAPQSTLVALEGFTSCNITGNNFIGGTSARVITAGSSELDISKIYKVKNLSRFQALAGSGNYDSAIIKNDAIYFNKRRNLWIKTPGQTAQSYVFARNYETTVYTDNQFVAIENNVIEIDVITFLGNATLGPKFFLIAVMNNVFQYTSGLHLGNNITVKEYIFSGNYLRSGSLIVSTISSSLTYQIKSLYFENNKIAKGLGSLLLFAYRDLIFKNNIFSVDEDIVLSYYDDLGFYGPGPPPIYNPPSVYAVKLQGYTDPCRIVVAGNRFLTIHSKTTALVIATPANVEINNNIFDLNTSGYTYSGLTDRIAVRFEPSGEINALSFTDNIIYAESGRNNRLLDFDSASNSISSVTVIDNRVPIYPGSVTQTLYALTKLITTYFKGQNFYSSYIDSFPPLPATQPTVVNPI